MLEIKNISVAYDKNVVVEKASLQLNKGEIGCFLGPSGCGKTTLLRAIAGFEDLQQGTIYLNGKKVGDKETQLAPEKRKVGMVFQDFALFPHLNIVDNITFGMRNKNQADKDKRVAQLLEMVGLSSYAGRYPHELSGGQQQRIALIRALAPKPDLLLLDEPFSSMDVELREALATEVRDILKQERITALFVTHNQNEAFIVADNIGVMRHGKLLQWASAYDLYHQPSCAFVADFVGQGVFLKGTVIDSHRVSTELAVLSGHVPKECKPNCPVKVLVRPDDIVHDDDSTMTARIVECHFRGSNYLYILALNNGEQVQVMVHSHHQHKIGELLGIKLEIDHLVVFPEKSSNH